MSRNSNKVKKWRKNTKNRMIDSMGGKCIICGYNKCSRAMDLHHLYPSKKELSFGAIIANPKKWETIVNELKKCVLLCNRCHQEVHAGFTEIPINPVTFDDNYIEYKELRRKTKCPICGKEKWNYNKTCSYSCASKLKGKIDWDKVNLNQLILIDKLSYCEIGRRLNVSDVAVRKRAKKLKIK